MKDRRKTLIKGKEGWKGDINDRKEDTKGRKDNGKTKEG